MRLWFMAGLALPVLPSAVSLAQTMVPDAYLLDLLGRFKQAPMGPAGTSQFAPSPMDVGRQGLSGGGRVTMRPIGLAGQETSRLELDYTARLRYGAPDPDRFAREVPEVNRFGPETPGNGRSGRETSDIDRFAREAPGGRRFGRETPDMGRFGRETPDVARFGRETSDIDRFAREAPDIRRFGREQPEAGRSEGETSDIGRFERVAPDVSVPLLRQFGYRMLDNLGVADGVVAMGAINDNYWLGIGDELVVTFRGQNNRSYRSRVDREGRVVLPNMPPILAAGRSFGEFRADLERRASTMFLKTDVFVSLGTVRNFPVMVLGAVHRPGMHRLAGVATVLDAIVVAGGVQKTGSLRRIKIIRGARAVPVDLYDLLLTGQLDQDLSIMEGDRVFVPPLGDTVAVAGEVKRPGIYELDATTSGLTVAEAVGLAGGTLRPQGHRYLKMSIKETGGDRVSEIANSRKAKMQAGEILLVAKAGYALAGVSFLDGHVSVPGPRSLEWDPTVGSVVNAPDVLLEDSYLPFAALETTDPETKARHFVPVDLRRITAGMSDVPLKPMDRLIVFGSDEIRFLSSRSVQAVIDGWSPRQGRCRGLQALSAVVSRSRSERFAHARLAVNPERRAAVPNGETCPAVFNRYPNLLPFVLDFVVAVRGEVRRPGIYPVVADTPLGSLVPVAGGLSLDADPGRIELTRFASDSIRRTIDARNASLREVALTPGDIVRFSPKFTGRDTGSVFLSGEFKRPGVYAIRRGERLSEIIERAGGLTEQAYPAGAVFTRIRVRQQEREAFERAALKLESDLAEALAKTDVTGESVAAIHKLVETLRTRDPIGRVVAEVDPSILAVRAELDTVLQPGDHLHMPKHPNHVTVSGEVLNPSTVQFRAGKTADEYIRAAGGITRAADDGRAFVILPNGEARPIVAKSSWNLSSVDIPPGSTIVVPRDPKPFDLLAFTANISDVLSKVAITAASLVVIGL
ncbi:MAG: SLBB domain-containing protein [Kiloniellaceae bacterium]